MNPVRQRILIDVNNSIRQYPYHKYEDLITFSVCAECFSDILDEINGIEPDFDEVIVTVNKKWLFEYMKKSGIEYPRQHLVNAYSSDDGIDWFDEANRNHMIAIIDFD